MSHDDKASPATQKAIEDEIRRLLQVLATTSVDCLPCVVADIFFIGSS